MAEAMNLSERQAEFAHELDTGEAVVQVGSGSPVPVKLRNYQVEKDVSDRELEKRQRERWENLSYEPRKTTKRFDDKIAPGRSDEVPEKEVPDDPREVDLSSEAVRFLEDVVEDPFKPLTERYQRFSSSYKGNQAKNELVDQGVVIEREVKNGENRKLLQLTEKGRSHVEQNTGLDPSHKGRGGIVHRYWQHFIKDVFEEAGWYAFVEKFDADVYINMGNNELVVEVAMGNNSREIKHVEQHLEKDFTVWIAVRDKETRERLKQRMKEQGLDSDRVVFRLLREFRDKEILPS
jgi:DNA-binding PadR family transcriptional regulator